MLDTIECSWAGSCVSVAFGCDISPQSGVERPVEDEDDRVEELAGVNES